MKQILLAIVMMTGISIGANAQTATKKEKATKHVCTTSCTDGKHMFAHGEKGHVCTTNCKNMLDKKIVLKDHVCTAACKEEKHMYAHGEKGHVCTDACKAKM